MGLSSLVYEQCSALILSQFNEQRVYKVSNNKITAGDDEEEYFVSVFVCVCEFIS